MSPETEINIAVANWSQHANLDQAKDGLYAWNLLCRVAMDNNERARFKARADAYRARIQELECMSTDPISIPSA